MKTVVIKMGDLTPGANGAKFYPVQLFFDDGHPDWLKNTLGTNDLPENLSLNNPPIDPVSGKPINGHEIREQFLKQVVASERLEAWGSYLHQLLFQGGVEQEWNRLNGLYPGEAAGSEGLRTILDIKPDKLRWLPWELIYKAPLPSFFDSANPFSRGTLHEKPNPKSFTWPIHALIVVGSAKDDPAVSAKQEIEAIQHAFIKSPVPIDWYISCRPKKEELRNLIKDFKPQILHFIGHGKNVGYSYLELTDKKEQQAPQEWTVQDIAIHLQPWKPRLAFVNACRTSSTDGQEHSWDIARAFSAVGVPAVIGMQADIKGIAAAAFSGKFYESLVNLPVDRSLAEARAAVSNSDNLSLKDRDWALATLFLQQVPEQILDIRPVLDKKTVNKYRLDGKLKETSDFVGRLRERRKLWYGVDQVTERDEEFSSLCIVVGSELIGKSALVQASMKVCALRNRNVSYIDIGYPETKNFVQILKIIREGDPKSSNIICAPLPQAPFADFDQKYGDLIKQPNAATTLAADNNLCEHFFNSYKAALSEISATEPLIIVLDHLNVEWDQFNNILAEKLITPIAQGLVGNCRMILVCTAEEFDKRLRKELKDAACVIEVSEWKKEKYEPLARQICLYNGFELKGHVESLITMTALGIESNWGPVILRKLIELLESMRGKIK